MKKFLHSMAIIGLAWTAQADLYNFNGTYVSMEYCTSGGSLIGFDDFDASLDNRAVLVIDFGVESYSFGFTWSGTATSEDMINSTVAGGGLTYQTVDYGTGPFVDSMSYNGLTIGDPLDFDIWVSSWNGTDGTDWTFATEGIRDHQLSNGSWDGFSEGLGMDYAPPATPVPEPGAMLLAGLGIAVIGIRRRHGRTSNAKR